MIKYIVIYRLESKSKQILKDFNTKMVFRLRFLPKTVKIDIYPNIDI